LAQISLPKPAKAYLAPARHIFKSSEKQRGGNFMKAYIEERAVEVANFIISSNATVRETAKKFGISKSTVHMVFPFRVGVIM